MPDDIETRAIITALVNALMETRGAGASDQQILDAAKYTFLNIVFHLNAEEEMIGVMPQLQQRIYSRWQERMKAEGMDQVRH